MCDDFYKAHFFDSPFALSLHELINIPRERANAVGVGNHTYSREESLEHLEELAFLAETAGAEGVCKIYQNRAKPDGATAVGRVSWKKSREMVKENNIVLAIFDDELTPLETRNLSRRWK